MVRRVIAAGLLLVVAVWAEFLLAPMLVMHATQAPAAQEPAPAVAGHHHAGALSHPCCPRVGPLPVAVPIVEFAASGLPCGEQHSCCFRPGPQSTPTVAGKDHDPSRDTELLNATAMNAPSTAAPRSSHLDGFAQSPPSDFSVILRI